MSRLIRVLGLMFVTLASSLAFAGAGEEANAVLDRWSAAYTSNDPEAIARIYSPDAILLGTVSPVISKGTEAILKYFSATKGSGNKNAIQERNTIVLGDEAAVVTGFYEFSGTRDGKPWVRPSRFTMLVTKRGGEWRIAHHHSSPHVLPKQ